MKKRTVTFLIAVLCAFSLTACAKKIDINKQFDELDVPQVTEVADTSLYENKAELFVTADSALNEIGYKYSFTGFYVFDSVDEVKEAFEDYLDCLVDEGYVEVDANLSSETDSTVENGEYRLNVRYSDEAYNWKNAEGKYILNVSVMYN